MAVEIRPIVIADAASYRRCWHTIAQEGRYMAVDKAPQLADVRRRLRGSLRKKSPFLVAVDGDRVVGWTAVFSSNLPAMRHCGLLVVHLLPDYRGIGLGTKLVAGVLKACGGRFNSVQLDVLGRNKPARRLFEKLGFKARAVVKKAAKMTYGFDDQVFMQKMMRREA